MKLTNHSLVIAAALTGLLLACHSPKTNKDNQTGKHSEKQVKKQDTIDAKEPEKTPDSSHQELTEYTPWQRISGEIPSLPDNAPGSTLNTEYEEIQNIQSDGKTLQEDIAWDSIHEGIHWKSLDKGLFLGKFKAQKKSIYSDSLVLILKINPKYYSFELISANEDMSTKKTARQWAQKKNLIAAVNAGMFMAGSWANTGYMKDSSYINNAHMNQEYNTMAAFNRKDASVPEFQIIDLKNQDWNKYRDKYHSYVQGLRMISSNQANCWGKSNRKWSMVCLAMDTEKNALFIYTRSPYSVHDFNNILLNSSLHIHSAQYLEGGPETSFYLKHNGLELNKCGSYETNFQENNNNNFQWGIPNVIGVRKK